MKLARRWGSTDGGGRYEILATVGSFHGRTFGTLTATGNNVNVHAKFTGFSDPTTSAVSGSVGFGAVCACADRLTAINAAKAPIRDSIFLCVMCCRSGRSGLLVSGPLTRCTRF